MKKTAAVLFLCLSLCLSACADSREQQSAEAAERSGAEQFSARELDGSYDAASAAIIELKGSGAECSSDGVEISGGSIRIVDEGTYILRGELEKGMLIVDCGDTKKVQLVLDGAAIHSESSAAIYVRRADKVFITSAPDSENSLSNGGSFADIDENNIDAVIFSKADLCLNGEGSLSLVSPGGHGIVSKDSLSIGGGSYDISCSGHGLEGRDDVCIACGSFVITAGKDGIHSENDEDPELGFVCILSGSFRIDAGGDGVSAGAYMQLEGGDFSLCTGGGSENGEKSSSDSVGGFMGGGGRPGGGPGGMPGGERPGEGEGSAAQEDSVSMKGFKAGSLLSIYGGSYELDCADDGFHSNGSMSIHGGSFSVASGDDGFHGEERLEIYGGSINISESYEGIEALHIYICGGDISLVSSDDGLNAAGGTDGSGMGGRDGMFGAPGGFSAGSGSITIAGGRLDIRASGDGIDANGSLEISGGCIRVCGPVQGDTATLDYDTSALISGGSFIGTGGAGMAQSFGESPQGVIALNVGQQAAGTQIVLQDESGAVLLSHSPELPFAVVILSCPEMSAGGSYTVTVGELSGVFEAG